MQVTRALPVLLALAMLPAAQASLVHLSWSGDAYNVAFEANASSGPPTVRWTSEEGDGHVESRRAASVPGDKDAVFVASLPPREVSYSIGGREFLTKDPPASGDAVRIAFLSDMGRSENASAVWSAIERADVSLVILGGDISYSNGRPDKWDEWFRMVEPLASRIPVMTAFGNHESYCTDPGDYSIEACAMESMEYGEHFHMPNAPHRYYDFDWGPVHFVALDTEAYHSGPKGAPWTDPAEQFAFLEDSLQQRPDAWNLVFFHRPIYTSNAHDPRGAGDDAEAELVPVLERSPVDLVLTGHAHAYERTWAMRDGAVARESAYLVRGDGTVHVTSGGGGRSLYSDWGDPPGWSARRLTAYHFLLLEVTPQELRMRAMTPGGTTLDEVTIRMPLPGDREPVPTSPATPRPTTPSRTGSWPMTPDEVSGDALSDVPGPGVAPLLALLLALAWARRRRRG